MLARAPSKPAQSACGSTYEQLQEQQPCGCKLARAIDAIRSGVFLMFATLLQLFSCVVPTLAIQNAAERTSVRKALTKPGGAMHHWLQVIERLPHASATPFYLGEHPGLADAYIFVVASQYASGCVPGLSCRCALIKITHVHMMAFWARSLVYAAIASCLCATCRVKLQVMQPCLGSPRLLAQSDSEAQVEIIAP